MVREALDEPDAVLGAWDVVALKGGFGASDLTRSVLLLEGVARVAEAERPWGLVLKVLVPSADQDDPADITYWKREPLLQGSGLLDNMPAHLSAPRCFGCREQDNGSVWLWLERIQEDSDHTWSLERWALAARHLGQFNGAYLEGRPLPDVPWLGGQRLRRLLDRHSPLVAAIAAVHSNPALRQWWPQPVVDAILRLWAEREAFCAVLERLPQVFCHGDAIRRNLFSRRRPDGSAETVAIDWEFADYMAAGEEVGQTLSIAAAFFDIEPADLPILDEALFAGYLGGMHDTGWRGDPRAAFHVYRARGAP